MATDMDANEIEVPSWLRHFLDDHPKIAIVLQKAAKNGPPSLAPRLGSHSDIVGLTLVNDLLPRFSVVNDRLTRLIVTDHPTLPRQIGELTAFGILKLSCNLAKLPPEVGQLFALQSLDLFNNELTSLPWEISQLSALALLVPQPIELYFVVIGSPHFLEIFLQH